MRILRTAVLSFVFIAVTYLVCLILALFHPFHELFVFITWLRLPLNPKFDLPEYYGFAHNSVRNFQLTTYDDLTLGAWHILPNEYYDKHELRDKKDVDESVYDAALMDPIYDTAIYFHGNCLSRVASMRIDFYKTLSSRYPKLNILALDYRGFGDSDGHPSELGLKLDAQAAYNWLLFKKVPSDRITLIGHSLGTGVAMTLAHDLSKAGTPPNALILQAAFTSIGKALYHYRLFETFPIFWLFRKLRIPEEFLISRFRQKFDSLSRISDVDCPILIIVGNYDFEFPSFHSKQLFYGALGQIKLISDMNWLKNDSSIQVHKVEHEAIVYTGTKQSKINPSSSSLVQLVLLEHANHNNLGYYNYLYKAMDGVTLWPKTM